MIAVVVPVYNVQDYLEKCVRSLICQTYKDLKIILVDDGSTDLSGKMCDEYAQEDKRIVVIHKENGGLSDARNFGIDKAISLGCDQIGFVDSDDWVDPDMFEKLHGMIEDKNADVASCTMYREYPDETVVKEITSSDYSGEEAASAIICGKVSDSCCDKLWNIHMWQEDRFPKGRVLEDYATVYRVVERAGKVTVSSSPGYHYLCRYNSILRSHDIDLLVNFWLAAKERYEYFGKRADEATKEILLYDCVYSLGRLWSWIWENRKAIKEKYADVITEACEYSRKTFPVFASKKYNLQVRLGIFFSHYSNNLSYFGIYILNKVRRLVLRKN